jgi:hypothetical protein
MHTIDAHNQCIMHIDFWQMFKFNYKHINAHKFDTNKLTLLFDCQLTLHAKVLDLIHKDERFLELENRIDINQV